MVLHPQSATIGHDRGLAGTDRSGRKRDPVDHLIDLPSHRIEKNRDRLSLVDNPHPVAGDMHMAGAQQSALRTSADVLFGQCGAAERAAGLSRRSHSFDDVSA